MAAQTGNARIAGVIGAPIGHSMSPALHEYWLSRYDIDGAYIPMEVSVDDFSGALKTLPKLGLRGCNVTLPHKEAAFVTVDITTDTAKAIGAVNTVIVQPDGSLLGDNTDAYGFISNISQHCPEWQSTVSHALILGAGGAARAAAVGLIEKNCQRITITNRTKAKADALKAALLENFPHSIITVAEWDNVESYQLPTVDLLINSTQLGMKGQAALSLPLDQLPAHAIVTDIVYNPLITPLLHDAKTRGLKTIDGLGMLLWQAAAGFEAWYGTKAEVDEGLRNHIIAIMQQ